MVITAHDPFTYILKAALPSDPQIGGGLWLRRGRSESVKSGVLNTFFMSNISTTFVFLMKIKK